MANTAQARKRARQSVALNKHNSSLRSMLRTAIKRVRTAIETGDKSAAADILQKATSVIDRVADKNIIHKNKAARHKSRLSAAVKALALSLHCPVTLNNVSVGKASSGFSSGLISGFSNGFTWRVDAIC
jgi:small subunit ribosomal protein S20